MGIEPTWRALQDYSTLHGALGLFALVVRILCTSQTRRSAPTASAVGALPATDSVVMGGGVRPLGAVRFQSAVQELPSSSRGS